MTGAGAPGPEESGTPRRRIGPYEQSLLESRERVDAAAREHARRRRRTRLVAVGATLVLVAGVGYGAYRYLGQRDVPTAVPATAARPVSCDRPVTVRVSAAPAVAPTVAAAAEALARHADAPCAAYTVTADDPYAVAGSLGGTGRPDAWITDSGAWVRRAEVVSGSPVRAGAPFATSPVLVAMDEESAARLGDRLGWADLLGGSVPVRLADPNRSAASRLALGVASTALPDARLQALAAASAAGAAGATGTTGTTGATAAGDLAGVAAARGGAGAVTSQAQLVAWNAAHPDQPLAAVAPTEGAPPLEYSVVPLTTDAAKARLVSALEAHLRSGEAQTLLQAAGFRTPGGAPKDPSPLYGTITVSGAADDRAPARAAQLWTSAARPTQALLAIDVSGSMLERTPEGTRLSVVQRAAERAAAGASPTLVASLWVYSLHVGPQADDFRQLTAYGVLGNSRSLEAFVDAVAGLDSYVGGGSGLYDTIAAAYDRARATWQPGRTNTVVVVADGPNEDDYGLSLALLERRLAAAKDPARPVRVVVIGIGGRPDAAAVRRIVAVTGGEYVATTDVGDLEPALRRALGG